MLFKDLPNCTPKLVSTGSSKSPKHRPGFYQTMTNDRSGRQARGSLFWSSGWQRLNQVCTVWKINFTTIITEDFLTWLFPAPPPEDRCWCLLKAKAGNREPEKSQAAKKNHQANWHTACKDKVARSAPLQKSLSLECQKIISNLWWKAFLRQHDHTFASYGQPTEIFIKEIFKRHCISF